MRRMVARITAALFPLAIALTIGHSARADPTETLPNDALAAEAERLFDEGKSLLATDDWTASCALFEASAKLVEAVPALVKVARCAAHAGQRVKAIEVYEQALATKSRPDLERLVRAELFELQQQTPSIRVTLVEPETGVVLRRNGRLMPNTDWEHLWTDVGALEHLEAEAPGYHAASFDVSAKNDGESLEVRIALTADEVPVTPKAPPPPRSDVQRSAGWAIAGGGAVALGLGAAFSVEYLVRKGSLFDDCTATLTDGRHVCPTTTSSLYDAVVAARTRTAVLLSVGAAFAAGGIVLVLTAPERSAPDRSADGEATGLLGVSRDGPTRQLSGSGAVSDLWVGLSSSGIVSFGGAF